MIAKLFSVSTDMNNNILNEQILFYVLKNPQKINVILPWILVFSSDIWEIWQLY